MECLGLNFVGNFCGGICVLSVWLWVRGESDRCWAGRGAVAALETAEWVIARPINSVHGTCLFVYWDFERANGRFGEAS
jgi:hypothetical protein